MRWPATPAGRRTLGQVVAYTTPFPASTLVLIIHGAGWMAVTVLVCWLAWAVGGRLAADDNPLDGA